MYKLYQYNDNDFRVVCLSEHSKHNSKIIDDNFISLDNSLQCAISRSKRMVREYALCNNFQYFVTLTVASANCDRFSLTSCEELIRKILKQYKRKNKDFIYLLIAEKHEDGAYHFHGLFGGCPSDDIVLFRRSDFNKLPLYILRYIDNNKEIYYSKIFNQHLGFCTLTKIKDLSRVSNYITKYILKNPLRNEAGTLYICSRGLKKSYSYEICPIDFDKLSDILPKPCKKQHFRQDKNYFNTEYIKVIDFRLDVLERKQIRYLQDNIKEMPTIIDFLKNRIKKWG